MTPQPFVSVIVPVFNDAARLKFCVQALEGQSYPSERFEVIVVDNASTEDIEGVLRDFPHASYAFERKPSSYAARNRGLELAQGELLAFTDADCIPAPDWLEAGAQRLLIHPECGLVGGDIELFFKDPKRPTLAELYESVYGFNQKKQVTEQVYSVTANLFTFRRVVERVGPFDAELKSGGDREWCGRVVAAGYPLVYAPEVVIRHPARASFREMVQRERRFTGFAYQELSAQHASTAAYARQLVRMLVKIPRQTRGAFRRAGDMRPNDKLKVASVVALQRFVRVAELAKLRLGGEARR